MSMKIYLSGKITGDPDYKAKFAEAERITKERIENCVIRVVYGYALNSFFKTELRRIKDLTGGKDSFKTGLRETLFQELFHFFGLRTAGECCELPAFPVYIQRTVIILVGEPEFLELLEQFSDLLFFFETLHIGFNV